MFSWSGFLALVAWWISGGVVPLDPFAVAVILPQAALQQVDGQWGVFVRSGDHAEFHPVRRGAELATNVVIEDGVKPGETIAADGAYLLKSLWQKTQSGGDGNDD